MEDGDLFFTSSLSSRSAPWIADAPGTLDLIQLSAREYHKKKNLLNRFMKNFTFEYRHLDMELVEYLLDMQEKWCEIKECADKKLGI